MTRHAKGGHHGKTEFDIGGLFGSLGEAVGLLSKLAEAGGSYTGQGEFSVKGLGDKARGVYGFTIRTGIGGDAGATVERFGNVHSSREGFVVDEVREPLADVFDEKNDVVVTAELPGAKESEIVVEIKGDMLTIESKGDRSYAKEIVLPVEVDAASMTRTYNNGVLEIRMRKKVS